MRLLAILFVCITLFLMSCQKEVSYATDNGSNQGNGGGGGNNNGTLLVKMVQKSTTDSLVTLYAYDASKRLINLKHSGISQGTVLNTEYRYYRNSSGIITSFTTIEPALVAYGIDSFVTKINYDVANSRYAGFVLNLNLQGFIVSDSSVFVYDNSGNVIENDVWESPTGDGTNYYYTGKFVYNHANGNMTQLDIHDVDQSGTETFTATTKATYDSNPNSLFLGNEGYVLGHEEWACINNIAGEQLSDSGGPADNQTVSYVYTYGSDNKPLTAMATSLPDNTMVNITYFYQ